MKNLDGQKLVSAVVDPRDSSTRFEFDLGAVLECRRMWQEAELWSLYEPRDYCLSVFGDGTFTRGKDSSTPGELKRRRITSG